MPGFSVISQTDFSGGMWPSPTPERLPQNAVYDATNALVDDTGGLYRRGGVTFFAGTFPLTQILWVWQGLLTGGNRTLFATASNVYSINGGTVTTLGAYTGMSTGANRPAVLGGKMFLPGGNVTYDGTTVGTGFFNQPYFASVANRLVSASNNTVFFSKVGDPATWTSTDFWLIPGGATILGLAPLRDSLIVFTDRGTWVISNMALNLTDADGNVQQRLDLYSPDMILWGTGAAGVVGYHGGLIVPARDGVWLMQLGVTSEAATPLQPLSRPLANAYRVYLDSGWAPGQAAIFRGHYFLPILSGTTPIRCLVCRLDLPGRPWTQFDLNGGAAAFTPSQDGKTLIGGIPSASGASKLATLNYFDGTGNDIFGTAPPMSVTTRDYLTGPLTNNTAIKVRFGYRLSDASGTAAIRYGGTADGAYIITTPTSLGTLPATTGLFSTKTIPIGKRTRAVRYKFSTAGTATQATLQSIETFVRQQGRQ